MSDINWLFIAALVGPLLIMLGVYGYGLHQETRSPDRGSAEDR